MGVIRESIAIAIAKRALFKNMKATNSESYVVLLMITGLVGPYGAYLQYLSEYSGAYVDRVNQEEIKVWHHSRMSAVLGRRG